MAAVYVHACAADNITAQGECTATIWVEKPEQVLPPLTLAEGTAIAFAIAGIWTLGVIFRVYARTAKERF